MHQSVYSSSYGSSRAIVAGIDAYKHCGQLSYACSDADAVAGTLRTRFAFAPNDASGSSVESEELSPESHEPQVKTAASNPKPKIQNPKSAGRFATGESGDESHALQEEEEETPHWMESYCDQIIEAVKKAC
jgi:hypothetical protein